MTFHHQFCDRQAGGADPPVHRVQSHLAHRRPQVVDRGTVVDTIDDDRDREIDGTRRALLKPAERTIGPIRAEEKAARTAAVRKILGHTGAEPACHRVTCRHRVELYGIVLFGVPIRVSTVVPANHDHGDALGHGHLLATVHDGATLCGNVLRHCLKTGRPRPDDRRVGQGGPGRRVEGMIPVAVPGQQQVDPGGTAQRGQHTADRLHIRPIGLTRAGKPARPTVKRRLRNAREVAVGDHPGVADLVVEIGQ